MNILDFLTNGQAGQLGTNGDGAERLVANLMLQRAELMKSLLDTPRDVDSDCQYPTGWISPELYHLLYMREPIATRVVEVYPRECFQVSPSVYEDEDTGNVTPFEEAWDALGKQLRGEQSFYQEEESSVIWDFLLDADIKSGIGHYAAILLGLDDGAPMDQPVDMIDATKPVKASAGGSSAASRRLLFMQVYPETAVRINALETDTQNPRYGQPTEYDISMMDPLEFSSLGLGASLPTNRAVVHWSRVVHISESGVLHTPRMRPVLNRLLDTRKLYSSSAEMYWRGAFPGYAIKTQPQLGADVDLNRKELETEITNYSNSLQRFLILMGMDVTALAPQVSDPSSQIDKQIEAICIQLGIPKRIFMGSERGELASSQDDAAFNDRLKQRQTGIITPRIIIPVVDRLISLRVLPRPAKGYRVSWPDLTSKSDEEKAGIAIQRTQAIASYTAGQLETTLAPMDFWTRIMGFTEDESQSIIANAEKVKAQKEKEQATKDAEAARVQAEAQAKIDAAQKAQAEANATGTEQTPTAPGLPTSPREPFSGKGSPSPTQPPPNGSMGQPGGSNAVGNSDVGNAFCPTGPGGGVDPSCSPKSATGSGGGSGGESPVVAYHGTSEKFLASIKETGIKPAAGAGGVAAYTTQTYFEAVDVAINHMAKEQGLKPGDKLAIVHVDASKGAEERAGPDYGQGPGKWSLFPKGVPPEQILKVDLYDAPALRKYLRTLEDPPSREDLSKFLIHGDRGSYVFVAIHEGEDSGVKPGGSNPGGADSTPVAHAFDPSQPRDSHGMWSQGSGGAEGGTGQKDNTRLVTDYLGRAPKGEVHVLPDAEFNTRFVSESDRLLGGVAAVRTPDGKIYLREGHESSGLHEMVHAAGLLEDNVSTYINEGMTQAVAEHIADTHSLAIPRTYQDEVRFVHDYLVPATGKPLSELARGYAGAKDKAKYLADSIMKAHGDKFSQEDWGSNPHESIYQDMRGAIGPSPHLDYLIHEVKVNTPIAHSDPTLVADFDPSQPRDKGGQWAKEGGSGGDGGGGGFPRKTLTGISDKFRGEVLDYVKKQGWDEKEFEHRLDHEVHHHKTVLAARSAQESSTHEQIVKDVMGQVMSQMRTEARTRDAEEFIKLREANLAKDVPPPPVMGPSTAAVKVVSKRSVKYVEDRVKSVIGEHATLQDVASLAGADSAATVSITPGRQADRITVRVKHPDYASRRTIYRDDDGNLVIHNDEFFVKYGSTGKGLGAEVFGRQVENAQKHGVSRLETHAGGPPEMNGYYTWPRFGYDQTFASLDKFATPWIAKSLQGARDRFPGAKSVGDVFLHPDGPAWWKVNGKSMPDAKFDLTPGSRSLKVWHSYLAERASRQPLTHADLLMAFNADPLDPEIDEIGNGEENYDFSPEVEAALDAAWKKLREELGGKSPVAHFDPSQPRDKGGKWAKGSGGGQESASSTPRSGLLDTIKGWFKREHKPDAATVDRQLSRLDKETDYKSYSVVKVPLSAVRPTEGLSRYTHKSHDEFKRMYSEELHAVAPPAVLKVANHYLIYDGHNRYKAAVEAKASHVWVVVLHGNKYQSQYEKSFESGRYPAVNDSREEIGQWEYHASLMNNFDPSYLSAEEISVLINSGELDVNAICRDSHGRFASCGAAGLPPSERSGVSEARMVHARHLVEQVRSAKTPDPATVKQLADHLGTLTVAQLHSLKKEYGLSASGKNKAVLKEKLTARFSQKSTAPAAISTTTAPKATEAAQAPEAKETAPVSKPVVLAPTPRSPSPAGPVKIPLGTFGVPKNIIWKTAEKDAHNVALKILGRHAKAHDLVAVAGIPDGATVTVGGYHSATGLAITVSARGTTPVKNPDTGKVEDKPYHAERTLHINDNGTRSIHNELFEGEGSGLAMFGRQVENATKWGFTHIETHAAGQGSGMAGERPPKGSYNGYYTWPRFGYDGKISPVVMGKMPDSVHASAEAAGGKISGLMSTKEGRDWWLGHGDSLDVKFDLTPGSYSQDALNTYLKHRGVLK